MTGYSRGTHIHLIGIGGIGLSAIARVLHGWGHPVTGSDRQASTLTEALAAEGIGVHIGHEAANVPDSGVVVVSSAVPGSNPEVVEARRRGLPVLKREQFLAVLTAGKETIAVAGTHGKTTTSAMIAWILAEASLDPTFVVGGVLKNLHTNARAGAGAHFVIEADEYDRAFLGLTPWVAVLTALEHDHPDYYPTFAEMRAAYAAFVQRLVPGGLLVVCGDDRNALELAIESAPDIGSAKEPAAKRSALRLTTYGLAREWDWWADPGAKALALGNSAAFEVRHKGARLGLCALQVPGEHNVLNALAAIAATDAAGVPFGTAAAALTRFRGTERRFEVKGDAAGITVVDDYAHHPTEIQATLKAARIKYPGRPLWVVFQPHTYSRTAALLDAFASAFQDADHVLVTEIYAAREVNTLGMSGAELVARMAHADVRFVPELDEAVQVLWRDVAPGAVVITLGAGTGYQVGERLLDRLMQRAASITQEGEVK
ncbi:MAG: UDP-N-acetylmuramate--L-alanine ligase [Anaerolineae bacterium]|nr:UDP-N-acetylmuramate--L-alanine ligase [Anaerolineae bacterium]